MAKKEPRIARLNNRFTEEKTLENIREKKRRKRLKRRMQFILVAGMLLVLLIGANLVRSYFKLQELEEQRVVARQELETLELHQEDLDFYISLLEDEEYVAKLARSEYYLTRDNEIVFSFPDDRSPDHVEATEDGPDLGDEDLGQNEDEDEAKSEQE
ncbi:Cell division protein DivIC (FtsB), stabilizes FtsL against RasP cleavage [Alkalibacterium sp. AK22]|uniref:FtsB family cell division protein n=1 Tax=Alkalibacterium sp. AK22 TaxID=1229520 RepID=UPI00044719AD|nr:septum formation initiator family protein [Alkalibacterium sp. AK22]EXJ23438.1 Cell division protein DivIC (FtsB), stabilizes FtsL against RasP cleavage [Alkalibacterium sp. AK22]